MMQPSTSIMAAFCYVMSAMIWKIGTVLVYYGQVETWFVAFITVLVITSGLMFQFEGLINTQEQHP
jgi:hypothetical protein